MKLDGGELHLLRFIAKGVDTDGWAKVSQIIWPLYEKLPNDLVEKRPSDNGGHMRLTENGKTLLRYI